MRVLRQVTRRQGKYVAGIEAAIQHVNDQIEEVQARKAFISYYEQQDPMHARQQMGQQQLFDLGMDAGLQAARRAVGEHRPKSSSVANHTCGCSELLGHQKAVGLQPLNHIPEPEEQKQPCASHCVRVQLILMPTYRRSA